MSFKIMPLLRSFSSNISPLIPIPKKKTFLLLQGIKGNIMDLKPIG